MTVPATTRKAGPYTGTGSQTVFPFSFKIFATTDVKVVVADLAGVETTLSSGYTVTANSDQVASPGGNVTMTVAPATGYKLSLLGSLPYDQTLAIPGGGNFNPIALENALDRVVEQVQQVVEANSRVLTLPATATASPSMPAPEANKFVAWNGSATALQNVDPTTLITIGAYGTAIPDVFTGTGSQTAFTLTANPGGLGNLDVAVGGVTQLPGVDFTWTSGTTLNFTVAPPNGVKVLARYMQALPQGTIDWYSIAGAPVTDVKKFGAKGDGVTDDTAAIQGALNTGKAVFFPDGSYLVTNALTCATTGQMIYGTGRRTAYLTVKSTFNLSALGVFVCTSGEEGPMWKDLGIRFTQPDTTVRANLIAYPPAIYANATPRFTISNLSITNAKTGIDMRGNSGGAFIDLLEMSAYDYGIRIDGSLDSIRIKRMHFWNFSLTANQASIFQDGNVVGVDAGTADDLHIEDSLFINKGKHLNFFSGTASRGPFGNVVNCDFDTYANVTITAGNINFAACFFTIGDAAMQALNQTGGRTRFSSCEFEAAVTLSNPMIQLSGSNAGSTFANLAQFENCLVQITGDSKAFDASASAGVSILKLTGCVIFAPSNTSPVNPLVNVGSNARITASLNRVSDKGTGTGNWLVIANDDHHAVIGNAPTGWGQSLPATYTNAVEFGGAGSSDAWKSYVSTLGVSSGALTTAGVTMRYKQIGKTVIVQATITITTNGTGAGFLTLTLPKVANATFIGTGREVASTGKSVTATLPSGTSTLNINYYDNTYPGGNGTQVNVQITYESQ